VAKRKRRELINRRIVCHALDRLQRSTLRIILSNNNPTKPNSSWSLISIYCLEYCGPKPINEGRRID
jgi:hypothetical protein